MEIMNVENSSQFFLTKERKGAQWDVKSRSIFNVEIIALYTYTHHDPWQWR